MYSSFEWCYRSSTAKTHVLLIRAHNYVNNYFVKTWILKYIITLIILVLKIKKFAKVGKEMGR